jgi:hypothetical protein
MGLELKASIGGVQQIGPAEITALFREAEISPRKRAHLLLHRDHADQVQRLLIACCVGTCTSALLDATCACCSDWSEGDSYNHHNNASDFAF